MTASFSLENQPQPARIVIAILGLFLVGRHEPPFMLQMPLH